MNSFKKLDEILFLTLYFHPEEMKRKLNSIAVLQTRLLWLLWQQFLYAFLFIS